MMTKEKLQVAFLLAAFSLVLIELWWSRSRRLGLYDRKETRANFGVLFGMLIAKSIFLGYEWTVLSAFSPIVTEQFPKTLLGFGLCFVAVDFVYYWYHRCSHEWPWLWSFHMVHHSATRMNLSASFRLNWFAPLVTVWFFVPLAWVGFPIEFILGSLALNLAYQFFLHTETVPKLPVVEGLLNTPSAHRVHHGRNEAYLDKNYGGFFAFWDVWFGTYAQEQEAVVYGTTDGFNASNPIRLVVGSILKVFRTMVLRRQRSL
ncbi:MAG: sterol desaturase family protein [Acidobacteria bacterium]|nr:sterol desaturase family protein [Acidobacteriota bacterium]